LPFFYRKNGKMTHIHSEPHWHLQIFKRKMANGRYFKILKITISVQPFELSQRNLPGRHKGPLWTLLKVEFSIYLNSNEADDCGESHFELSCRVISDKVQHCGRPVYEI